MGNDRRPDFKAMDQNRTENGGKKVKKGRGKQLTAMMLSFMLITGAIAGPVSAAEKGTEKTAAEAIAEECNEQLSEGAMDGAEEGFADSAVKDTAESAGEETEDPGTEDTAAAAPEEASDTVIEDAAEAATEESAEAITEETAEAAAEEYAETVADDTADAAAEEYAESVTEDTSESSAEESVDTAVDDVAETAREEAADTAGEAAVDHSTADHEESPAASDPAGAEGEPTEETVDVLPGESVDGVEGSEKETTRNPDSEDGSDPEKEVPDISVHEDEEVSSEAEMDGETEGSDIVKSGTCGDDLIWTLNSEAVLTISGTGNMTDYTSDSPWEYLGIKEVIIQNGVESIGGYAFYECTGLESVTIPDSLTEIRENAFTGCSSLTDIYYYNGDTYGTLDEWSAINIPFGCDELENITLHCLISSGRCGPDLAWTLNSDGTLTISGTGTMYDYDDDDDNMMPWSLYRSDYYAAGKYYGITKIVIENGVTTIGNRAFWGCDVLTDVTIPESITRIGRYAFDYCRILESITIPDHVTQIGEGAFYRCCGFKELTIPESVTSIEEYTFSFCDSLERITIPESVTSIGWEAFSGCSSLRDIVIPQGVLNIGDFAFSNCTGLTGVSIPESIQTIGESVFDKCASLENVIIPEGVTEIPAQTFYDCTSLTSVSIPLSVTHIGSDAFSGCTSLAEVNYAGTSAGWETNIYIEWGNECLTEAELHCADNGTTEDSGKCGENLTWSLDEEGTLTISGSGQMYSYKPSDDRPLPWPVEKIKTVLIEEGATSIGDWAFVECENLTSVTIPEGVISIGESAFDTCGKLQTVTVPSSLKTIGDYAFFACYSLGEFDFPEGLLEIGGEAFSHCNSLKSVTIPSSVTKLGGEYESPFRSFLSCSSLEKIDVDPKNGVFASVDGVLFSHDKKELICCPGGRKGFYEIPSYVEDLGPHAFYGCAGLTGVSIPDGVRCIYLWAFMDCTGLAEVVIPSSVVEIEQYAFRNCQSLESVTIPKDVSSIARFAFEGCSGLTDVYYEGTESEWNEIEIEEEGNEPLFNAVLHFRGEHSHSLVLVERVEPTDENAGHIAYWLCTDCGKMFMGADGTGELLPDQVILPATGDISGTGGHGTGGDETENIVASGTCGENTFWSLNEAGTLTISGEGYQVENVWHPDYDNEIRNVVVEEGITNLEEGAFDGCMNLASVTLPEGLREIPSYSFSGCIHLTEINIPESVTFIGKSAFSNCDSLINADIPSNVETIGIGAFYDCTSLKSVTIQDGVTEIDMFAFAYCTNLTDVTIPKSVTTIGECAFKGCENLTTVTYTGTEADWSGISILGSNEALMGAALHFITYDLEEAEVAPLAAAVYTGAAVTPKPVVMVGNTVLAEGSDYSLSYTNNVNAGTAKVTITGIGKYTGSTAVTFKINPASIKDAVVSGLKAVTYTGKAIVQTPVVTLDGKKLTKDTHYTVSCYNNINAGTAKVDILGKGNYKGSVTASFKINKAAQSITVKASDASVAVGRTTTVSITGNKGTKSFSSSNTAVATVTSAGKVTAKKVGTVKITAKSGATSNYKEASKTVTIKVVPAVTASLTAENLADGIKLTWKKVTGATGYKVYRGSTLLKTITSGSTVTYTDKKAITNGTKYTFKVIATASTGNSAAKTVIIWRLARPAINSAAKTGSGKMTVGWRKNAKATGYQIQYSPSKTFASGVKTVNINKAATVSRDITGLTNGKTYYVRIRSHKTAGSTKYWSAWSAAWTVKIGK